MAVEVAATTAISPEHGGPNPGARGMVGGGASRAVGEATNGNLKRKEEQSLNIYVIVESKRQLAGVLCFFLHAYGWDIPATARGFFHTRYYCPGIPQNSKFFLYF